MANLVLNGEPINTIDEIDKIAANYVEADMLDAFRNGLLEEWLREQLEDDMADAIGKLKEGKNLADNIIKVLGLDKDECMASQRRIDAESAKAAEKARQKEASRTEADVHASTHKTRKRKTKENNDDALEVDSAMKGTEPKKRRCRKKDQDHSVVDVSPEDAVSEEETIESLIERANSGDDDAQAQLVKFYSEQENYPEAARWCRVMANADNSAAQNLLGNFFAQGLGVKKNNKQAARWYRMAAENDEPDADAMNSLGMFYDEGKGVEQDKEEAMKWFKMAAACKHPWGAYNVGMCYWENEGLDYEGEDDDCYDDETRLRKARTFFCRADSWGCTDARQMLGDVKTALKELKKQADAYNYNQLKREADPLYAAKQDWENDDVVGAIGNAAKGIFRKLSIFG